MGKCRRVNWFEKRRRVKWPRIFKICEKYLRNSKKKNIPEHPPSVQIVLVLVRIQSIMYDAHESLQIILFVANLNRSHAKMRPTVSNMRLEYSLNLLTSSNFDLALSKRSV